MNNMYVFGAASVAFLEAPNTFNRESQHPPLILRNGRSSDLPPGFSERLPDQCAVADMFCPIKWRLTAAGLSGICTRVPF